MGLKAGEHIYCRVTSTGERFGASVEAAGDSSITVAPSAGLQSAVSAGQYVVVSGMDGEYYTEVSEASSGRLVLRRLWNEKREYFRVDDVLPVNIRRLDDRSPRKIARLVSGYTLETALYEAPDQSISPQLWKMIADINVKLDLIMDKLNLSTEGFGSVQDKNVNLSASGIRIVSDEEVLEGDVVEVKLMLPSLPPVGIQAHGEVVRVRDTGDGRFEVGVRFADMSEEVREEIIQYALKRQREIIIGRKRQSGNDQR